MRLRALRPLPLATFVATVAVEVVAAVLSWGLEPFYDTVLYAVFSATLVGTGTLVLTRYPRHPIGWLLCVNGMAGVLGDLAQGWGLRAAAEGWPGGVTAEWIQTASWLPTAPVLVLTILLFPDGRLPGRRWRIVVWASVLGVLLAEPGWTLDPDTGGVFVGGRNPFAVTWLPTDLMFGVGFSLTAASLIAALIGLTVRFRGSVAVERQQLKWFAFAGAVLVVVLPVAVVLWISAPVVMPGCGGCRGFALMLPALALTAWAVVIGIAILRYRLYDIDLVISRAIAYVTLTAILAAVFVAAVLLLGTVGGHGSSLVTAAATLAAATVFHLLRQRVQDRLDRRFRRARHDALRSVAAFLDELRAGRAEPEQVTAVLRSAVDDPRLELRFVLQPGEPPVDERGHPVTDVPDDGYERFAVQRAGITLAEVVWPAGTPAQQALVPGVVDAAGLAIEVARLRVELRRRLDEVEASRSRIVAVADEERRRIERDLHDGAQQRLVSIGLALRHAQHQLGPGATDTAGRTLDDAIVQIAEAINELRELAQGLHPALDRGLPRALRELATRVPLPVEVAAATERFPIEIETAAYFVASEGLTNAVKHAGAARVTLRAVRQGGRLVVSVTDDGIGGAAAHNGSGLTGLSDRVAAMGGSLRVDSIPGQGTTLTAEIPCAS